MSNMTAPDSAHLLVRGEPRDGALSMPLLLSRPSSLRVALSVAIVVPAVFTLGALAGSRPAVRPRGPRFAASC